MFLYPVKLPRGVLETIAVSLRLGQSLHQHLVVCCRIGLTVNDAADDIQLADIDVGGLLYELFDCWCVRLGP